MEVAQFETEKWGGGGPTSYPGCSHEEYPTSYPGLFINNPDTGHKVLNSDWPIKTHDPRSKMLESRQINIANTNFRAFRQSNKRRIIILEGNKNCFPRTTESEASQDLHRSKMAQVKPESKEILSSYV